MTTDLDGLRIQIGKLYDKRKIGDLNEKKFQQALADRTVDLYRALIAPRLGRDEAIECEHHTIFSHFKLTQSVLKEPEQQAVSLFATDRRLFRVRSVLIPDQPPTGDRRDRTGVDEISYRKIGSMRVRREIRWGEIAVGVVMAALAAIFSPWLDFTGPVLIGIGALGILHGLLLPTRWIEIAHIDPASTLEPVKIHALRKKTARALVKFLRDKLRLQ